ncbi:beta-ketoacyl synthase N-terminal-like domain-containing protein [Chondromyces crocatus]|uniref:3-oxoacyl-ACP synthase n=1 Tax=Chondromyces crocatus TaxID=52 RepID=A0A0K1EQS9_CHOCO|nr:beta-ketoacyl synthase N-terminal-like domain-containing protein [Chondromyces crocatus]AKT43191.1 3-oxoacyl-ACP synthase [Chondromyces crocatus]
MSGICAIATGAVSALGLGRDAYAAPRPGEPARVAIHEDPLLAAAGLLRPSAARAPAELGGRPGSDRATDLLLAALTQTSTALDVIRPAWRDERIGFVLGTSSGGMLTAERYFAALAAETPPADLSSLARGATYHAPFDAALDHLALPRIARKTQILAACAASTIALGMALRWLDRGACDLVLAGGYDALSLFVAAGFEALRATTPTRPRPFRLGRDGMSLGEGAAILALVPERETRGAPVLARIAGFGASTDAVHITAPDRTGAGLARAATRALADAACSPARVGLVSAHGTATPYNDAMESRAIASALRCDPPAPPPIVHPFKSQIGHTLGAAGALETLAAADALAASVAPAAASPGDLDPDAPALLLDRAEPRPLDAALKLSAAFGGANAALLLTASPTTRRPPPRRPVHLRGHAHITGYDRDALSSATGVARDRLARLDDLSRLGLAAVAALAAQIGRETLRGAGIVAGHALATIDTNDLYDARRRQRGARFVEPRLFPATSPNAIAGECAIVYQLTGPGFATSSGLGGSLEALLAASELVAAGDADRMVVVAADDDGPVGRRLLELTDPQQRRPSQGAVALLIQAESQGPTPLRRVDLDLPVDHQGPVGHLALLRWLEEGH